MLKSSGTLAELGKALALAQAEVENATKGSENPHFKSRYADLAEVLNTVRPVFAKHGLAVIQSPYLAEDRVGVETMLLHTSGEWLSGCVETPVQKRDPQGVGSAITYMRRYSLAAFCGVAQEDDDGEGAMDRKAGKPKADKGAKPPPTPPDVRATAAQLSEDPESPQALYDALQQEIRATGLLVGGGLDVAPEAVQALQERIRQLFSRDQKLGRAVFDEAKRLKVL